MKNKPLALTKRDRGLLEDLRQFGLHSTRHLAARHFPGIQHSTVMRRLRALEAAKHIQRIPDLNGAGNAWALDKAGAKLLVPAAAKINYPRFIQEHDLKLSALRLRLEEAGIAQAWKAEHEIRARVAARCGRDGLKDMNIPDGLMGAEVKGSREAIAIELELTQKNQYRYARIFSDYSSKASIWAFWYVVGSASIAKQLMTADRDTPARKELPYFLWSLLDEVMEDPLNATVNGAQGSFKVKEIWPPAAHAPAQGMGTQVEEEEAPARELTPENENQIESGVPG